MDEKKEILMRARIRELSVKRDEAFMVFVYNLIIFGAMLLDAFGIPMLPLLFLISPILAIAGICEWRSLTKKIEKRNMPLGWPDD